MSTQRKAVHSSLDERVRVRVADAEVRNRVVADFAEVAGAIVQQVHDVIAKSLTGRLKKAFESLDENDFAKVKMTISTAFSNQQMGLRDLASLARKEIAMLIIKRAVPRYRVGDDGVDPLDYFKQFYKEPFKTCGVPANGINSIDPNLHGMLKKRGQFPAITQSLSNG